MLAGLLYECPKAYVIISVTTYRNITALGMLLQNRSPKYRTSENYLGDDAILIDLVNSDFLNWFYFFFFIFFLCSVYVQSFHFFWQLSTVCLLYVC
jgi:hypothetical protein